VGGPLVSLILSLFLTAYLRVQLFVFFWDTFYPNTRWYFQVPCVAVCPSKNKSIQVS